MLAKEDWKKWDGTVIQFAKKLRTTVTHKKSVPTFVAVDVSSVSEASFSTSFLGAKLPMKTPPLDNADNGLEFELDFSTPGSHGYWSLGFKIPAKYWINKN